MDPMTIATLISKFGPVAANFVGSQLGLKQAGKRAAQQEKDALLKEQSIRSNMPQYEVSGAWKKYLQQSRQDPAADILRNESLRREASNVEALKSGGAKALIGGLGATSRNAATERAKIEADSLGRMQNALQTYAGVEQRASDMNIGNESRLAFADIARQQQLGDQARATKEGSVDARRQNIASLVGFGLGQFGQGHLAGLKSTNQDVAPIPTVGQNVNYNYSSNLGGGMSRASGMGGIQDLDAILKELIG